MANLVICGDHMDDFAIYTDEELRELYNWLTTQHRLVEDELAWRSRCEDLDQDKWGASHNG